MANYYLQVLVHFRCRRCGKCCTCRGEFAAEVYRHEGESLGFTMEVDHESGPGALWIYSDEYGEPEHVIRFVLRCAEVLNLNGLWGFTWGLSCSKPRLEAFGGGAQLLDLGRRESIDYIDCTHWLELRLAPDGACDAAPLQEAPP
jgi:hypothetical protein